MRGIMQDSRAVGRVEMERERATVPTRTPYPSTLQREDADTPSNRTKGMCASGGRRSGRGTETARRSGERRIHRSGDGARRTPSRRTSRCCPSPSSPAASASSPARTDLQHTWLIRVHREAVGPTSVWPQQTTPCRRSGRAGGTESFDALPRRSLHLAQKALMSVMSAPWKANLSFSRSTGGLRTDSGSL